MRGLSSETSYHSRIFIRYNFVSLKCFVMKILSLNVCHGIIKLQIYSVLPYNFAKSRIKRPRIVLCCDSS